MDAAQIRARVRALIRDKQLDCEEDAPLWAGTEGSKACAACGRAILLDGVEYEVLVGTRTVHFHPECHAIWEQECEQ